MEAVLFDTETTGLDAPELIEAAWLPIDIHGQALGTGFTKRYRPSKPIQLGAMATHGIMDEDLVDCEPSSAFRFPDGVDYMIGFNVDFDWRVIGEPPVKRIDACAMCRALWPEADSHSQAAMLYLLDRRNARCRLRDAHSALADVFNCLLILREIDRKAGCFVSFQEMWHASERMRVPTHITFGKHKGTAIKELPIDYRQWILRENVKSQGTADAFDPYLIRAVQMSMGIAVEATA